MAFTYDAWWAKDWAFDPADIDFGPLVFPSAGGPRSVYVAGWDSSEWGAVACVYDQSIVGASVGEASSFGSASLRTALAHNFAGEYTPPTDVIVHIFGSVGEQYITPQGFSTFDAGWVETVKWPKYIEPLGFTRTTVSTRASLHELLTQNHDFTTEYSAPPGNGILFDFVLEEGEMVAQGWLSSAFGSHQVVGTPEIRPSGFDHSVVSSDLSILLARRLLEPDGISQEAYGTPLVANSLRYVDVAGNGIVGLYGSATVQLGTRYVYPLYVAPGAFGSHMVDVDHEALPEGFDAALYGTAYVHDLTQWAHHHNAGPFTGYGEQWVSRSPRTLEPVGFPSTVEEFPSTRWGRPTTYNLKQVVYQTFAPGTEDGGVFGSYIHMTVENRNRPMTPLGWSSSRVSNLAFVENNADPVYPPTIGEEQWGLAMVADAIRHVYPEAWEEFYAHPLGTALHNDASVIAPSGWASADFGTPAWSNPPQDVRFVGRIDESAIGEAFIAPAIRTLTVPAGIDGFPVPDPLVQNAIRYLEPSGFTRPFQFGGHHLEERFTIFYPVGINANRMGLEHYVLNRNLEVYPYAYDQAEFGLHRVDLYTRYVEPLGIGEQAVPRPSIADSRQYVYGNGISPLAVWPGPVVTKIPPDPPATQTIYTAGYQWSVYGAGEVRRNQIDCEGFVATRYGDAEVRLIGAIVSSFNEDYPLFGTPWVRGPQTITVSSENVPGMNPQTFPTHDMKPRTIWATFDATEQAIRIHGGQWELVDEHLDLLDTGERPFFGSPTVTLFERGIAPSGSSFGEIGQPSVESTIRTIAPEGLRAWRVGIPKLPGPQTIDFLLGTDLEGGVFGEHDVQLQDREIEVPSIVTPGEGTVEGQYGTAYVDFYHRYRSPDGWDSSAFGEPSPLDNRNSPGLRVHFPDPFIPTGTVMTLWGDTFVSHWIREVAPDGFSSFDMRSTPGQFRERMRVRHGTRRLNPQSISAGDTGSPTVWQGTRHIYTDSIWRGNMVPAPDIRYRSVIALGGYGFDSSVFGDVQEWEAGKIKPQGEEYTLFGNVRTHRQMYANGVEPAGFGSHVVGPGANPQGWDALVFGEHVMVYADGNEFVCGFKPRALVLGDIDAGAIGSHTVSATNAILPGGIDSLAMGDVNVVRAMLASGWDSLDMRSWYAGEDYFDGDYHDPAYAVTVSHA